MPPHVVVIPFGVPKESRGLGLGLAALVHSFAQIDGQSVALAQLLAKPESNGPPGPVEAFVPPRAWRDLAGTGNAPSEVTTVLTGAFEPPGEGKGMLQLLAFDARDGSTRAKAEAHVDVDRAGETILGAFEGLWKELGGELGVVKDIGDLTWEALESVLRAERCALHDPVRGGPHDRLAAMLHLGRAVGDAPDARFPAGRLAAFALDAALAGQNAKVTEAALRALERATEDAPDQVDLSEATAALELRMGRAAEAEARVAHAIEREKGRARLYALLSEARRARGDLTGARDAVRAGIERVPGDPLLVTEDGIIQMEQGDAMGARHSWETVLRDRPLFPPAFTHMAQLALRECDVMSGGRLVDNALVGPSHPDVLRLATQLAFQMEAPGKARASRIAKLAEMLVAHAPGDVRAVLVLARALADSGEREQAVERLQRLELTAKGTPVAAESERARLAISDPKAALEIEAVLRAAYNVPEIDLDVITTRAEKLAVAHPGWLAHFAVGIASRRRERWDAAREAFLRAIEHAAGCTPAHMEIVAVFVALNDGEAAIRHAKRACELEGETARTLAVLATALLASKKREEAEVAIDRAILLDATDEANRALRERIRSARSPSGPMARVREVLGRWRKR